MIKLTILEISKLLRRKKTYVVIGAFVALLLLLSYGYYREEQNVKRMMSPEQQVASMQQSIDFQKKNIDRMKSDLDNAKTEEEKNKINSNIQAAQNNITETENSIEQLKNSKGEKISWQDTLKKQIESEENQLNNNTSYIGYDVGNDNSKNILKQRIAIDKYLLKNNIKPIEDYTFNAFNFVAKMVESLGTIFLAVGIAIFICDMISGECTPPTLKLLLTQPVSRGKVLFSKYISSILSSVIFIIGIEFVCFILIGVIFGFGNANYPVMVGTKYKFDMTQLVNNAHPLVPIEGTGHIIAIWKFASEVALLQAVFIIACTSFIFLISTLFRSSMVSMGVAVVSIIISSIVFLGLFAKSKITPYIFLIFGDTSSVLNSRIVTSFNNPNLTVNYFLIVMAAWTIVCYMVSHLLFTKRDILI